MLPAACPRRAIVIGPAFNGHVDGAGACPPEATTVVGRTQTFSPRWIRHGERQRASPSPKPVRPRWYALCVESETVGWSRLTGPAPEAEVHHVVPSTKEAQRAELHKTIWRVANDLRGSVDGWDFKSYVLGMLFYRFISENLTAYLNAHERAAGRPGFDYADLPDAEAEFGRAETVAEKPMWRDAIATHRSIFPAVGYYETQGGGRKRKRFYFHPIHLINFGDLLQFEKGSHKGGN